ncbi:MAG: hypothetical protein LBR15_03130 [Methanobrevibacter sp.]|jgi:hypothetical protein|nr:hypothetical protein [Candidatus Methanovirga australis]
MLKKIFSIGILAIMVLSCLGNVSAGELGLWMSTDNCIRDRGSTNIVYIERVEGTTTQGEVVPLANPFVDRRGRLENVGKLKHDYYFYFEKDSYFFDQITFYFNLCRYNETWTGNFRRNISFNITMPVHVDGWVYGINSETRSGMKFLADNYHLGSGETKMDTVNCWIGNKEAWKAPGGNFNEPQTRTVEFPNGQIMK